MADHGWSAGGRGVIYFYSTVNSRRWALNNLSLERDGQKPGSSSPTVPGYPISDISIRIGSPTNTSCRWSSSWVEGSMCSSESDHSQRLAINVEGTRHRAYRYPVTWDTWPRGRGMSASPLSDLTSDQNAKHMPANHGVGETNARKIELR